MVGVLQHGPRTHAPVPPRRPQARAPVLVVVDDAQLIDRASFAALPELAASAARSGHSEKAAVVIDRAAGALADSEPDTRSARGEALLHHSQAVLAAPEGAETSLLAALAVPGFARWSSKHAQALLSYAEWLRR